MKRRGVILRRIGMVAFAALMGAGAFRLFFFSTDLWRANDGRWSVVLLGAVAVLLWCLIGIKNWCAWELARKEAGQARGWQP